MKKFLMGTALVGAFTASALAIDVRPAVKPTRVSMNLATGEIEQGNGAATRLGGQIWQAIATQTFYVALDADQLLDWGDVGTASDPAEVGGFSMTYCADGPATNDQQIIFLGDENGFAARTPTFLAGFDITLLPGGVGGALGCWIVTFDLDALGFGFTVTGGDYDVVDGNLPNFSGAGLTDFGYTYGLLTPFGAGITTYGPFITHDGDANNPGVNGGPGIENAMDIFVGAQGSWPTFLGTFWYGGSPYAQHWMELFAPNGGGGGPSCPNNLPGCDNSDIFPAGAEDCIVNLSDLGVVLSNFAPGVPGKTRAQGDIFPLGGTGDGIVDLSDLGQMLTDFNTNCQ